jgi:hypothetical protein
MKRKQIEELPVKRPGRMPRKGEGKQVAAQLSGRYLVLDLWSDGAWIHRHVMDTETGEYASYDMEGRWTQENLANAFVGDIWGCPSENNLPISKEDRDLALGAIKVGWPSDIYERIEEAKRLLAGTSQNISDIATRCGFQNISYFSKQFRRFTGVTPREFRK